VHIAPLYTSLRYLTKPENKAILIRDFALTLAQLRLARADKDIVAGFFFAYERLSAAEGLQLAWEISKVESPEMREQIIHLTNPWIEAGKQEGLQQGLQQGLKQGLVKGRQQGEAELVLRLLSRRFGVLAVSQERAIRKLPLAKLVALAEALLEFTSRSDLSCWLRQNR
jgi:hypothetical protein